MSDYTPSQDFADKDALPAGDANKVIYGSDIDAELDAIATAIATKADAGAWTSVAHDTNNFGGTGSMGWSVDLADQVTFAYRQLGSTMTVAIVISNSSITGTPSTTLEITIPNGKVATKTMVQALAYAVDGATGVVPARIYTTASGTTLSIDKTSGAVWTTSTNATFIQGTISFEVNP